MRWLAPEWVTLPLSARRCCVRNSQNGAVAELSADQHAVLTACEGCHTLDEHAGTVRRKLGLRDADQATLAKWLDDFASIGLLISLDDLRRRFGAHTSWTPAPFAGIAIRTCDRPRLLARAVASAAALEARVGCRHRYHVLDDSREPASRADNARIVAGAGLDACYRDLSSSDPLAGELARAFPGERDAIDWLVGPAQDGEPTYGRPINLALLLTAGCRLLLLDDDAFLEPRRPPSPLHGFSVSSAPDELFCYVDQTEIERACPPIDIDPIAEHLRWLGAPVGVAWSRFERDASGIDVVELGAADVARFASGARIALTQNHALGDPGSSLFPFHLLTLPRASRQHVLADPARISSAFHERINWRGQLHPRLTPSRPLTFTTLAGLDNSALLPPTVRRERNEDLLFGEMTRIIDRGAWSLDLPFALPHWRSPAKQWLGPAADFRQEPAHFLMDYLDRTVAQVMSDRPSDRLRSVAAILIDLAAANESRLADLLEQQATDTASRVQFAIAATQDDPSVPTEWKDQLRPWLASPALSTRQSVVRERIASPAAVRALANQYGNALAIWPALWEWTRDRADHA